MTQLLLALACLAADDAAARVEAVKKLAGTSDEASLQKLVAALKDPDKGVRKAAAETIGTVKDEGGITPGPLGAVLTNKEEDPDVRLAAAKGLSTSPYKGAALEAYIRCITSISNKDRHLHQFGAQVTDILNKYSGEDFGKGKQTPMLWEQWWDDHKDKLRKDDEARRKAFAAKQ